MINVSDYDKSLHRQTTETFQIRAAATGKARSPMVDNHVRRTTSDDDEADRRRRRAAKSAGWHSSSKRYDDP